MHLGCEAQGGMDSLWLGTVHLNLTALKAKDIET